MAKTHDHEMVSIYPFNDDEVDQMMTTASEAVLMWGTKDGWPVGVTHAFVWHEGKIWITFSEHRHRTAAIRRDNRVSVNVSSQSYPEGASQDLPGGAITFKGTGEFFKTMRLKSGSIQRSQKKEIRTTKRGKISSTVCWILPYG